MATNRVQQALDTPIKPNWFTRGLQTVVNAGNASPIGQVVQTQQSLGKTRIAQPILEAIQQAQQGQRLQAALNLLGAGVNATPMGNAQNLAETYVSGGLQQLRGQGNAIQNARQLANTGNSGVVSQGLGVGGIAGAVGDMAVGVNPKHLVSAVSDPKTMGLYARDSLKDPLAIDPNAMSRVRKTIESEDLRDLDIALDILKNRKKDAAALKPEAKNMVEYLAERYLPRDKYSKWKDNPVKMGDWIANNRPEAKSIKRDSSGKFLSNFDIPNILHPKK